ncbi:MAG: EAL domain-containing protein, partial [Actinobacteria bacterium]|nr:EAL domain-containing protein [Actinomycetota bacterium]
LVSDLTPEQPEAASETEPAGPAVAHAIADAIHAALGRPFEIGGTEVYVDATVGISVYPLDADGTPILLRHADQAAQQAKRPGEAPTNQFAEDTSDKWGRLWLATRLRQAVEREDLLLHYQPIVNLRTLPGGDVPDRLGPHIYAFEALVRWRDREGIVPPAGFISLAEDLGLIDAIGDWVVREGCREALRWHRGGGEPTITFNVSLHELWQPNIVERIYTTVTEAGLETGSVVIEITESSAMTDPVRSERVLYELRRHGFTLAIDDFGTGHSSFGRLSELPCQVLKIDRMFVARLPDDAGPASMVTAMLELADRLGMRAVAEGIETVEQLEFLIARGCPLGQGFLFSRPVPAEQVALL